MEVELLVSSGQKKKTGEKVLIDEVFILANNPPDLTYPRIYDLSSVFRNIDNNIWASVLNGELVNDASSIEIINDVTYGFMPLDELDTYSVYLNTKKCYINTTMSDIKYLSDIFILDPENKISITTDNCGFSIQNIMDRSTISNGQTSYIINSDGYVDRTVFRIIQDKNTSNFIDIITPYRNFYISYVADYRHYNILSSPYPTYPLYAIGIKSIMYTYNYLPYENEITPD